MNLIPDVLKSTLTPGMRTVLLVGQRPYYTVRKVYSVLLVV